MLFTIVSYSRHKIFVDLYDALKSSLIELGHEVKGIQRSANRSGVNLFVKGRTIKGRLPKKAINILLFMEQKYWKNYSAGRLRYDYIIDIFKNNYEKYKSDNNFLCPVGYSEAFANTEKWDIERDYFLFGGNTPFRKGFEEASGFKLTSGIFEKPRDEEIMKSKINLMAKAYEQYELPSLHSSIILSKGKFLMPDVHKNYYPLIVGKHFMIYNKHSYEWWLTHDKERKEFEKNALEDYKENHSFTKYLREVLDQIKET